VASFLLGLAVDGDKVRLSITIGTHTHTFNIDLLLGASHKRRTGRRNRLIKYRTVLCRTTMSSLALQRYNDFLSWDSGVLVMGVLGIGRMRGEPEEPSLFVSSSGSEEESESNRIDDESLVTRPRLPEEEADELENLGLAISTMCLSLLNMLDVDTPRIPFQ
jgi:hypothetical protein